MKEKFDKFDKNENWEIVRKVYHSAINEYFGSAPLTNNDGSIKEFKLVPIDLTTIEAVKLRIIIQEVVKYFSLDDYAERDAAEEYRIIFSKDKLKELCINWCALEATVRFALLFYGICLTSEFDWGHADILFPTQLENEREQGETTSQLFIRLRSIRADHFKMRQEQYHLP